MNGGAGATAKDQCSAWRSARTLPELLRRVASDRPTTRAYLQLEDARDERGAVTFGELYDTARMLGAELLRQNLTGERALLIYPAGLDFVSALFGCLFSGVVAIPVPVPGPATRGRLMDRLNTIVADADARIVLTSSRLLESAKVGLASQRGPMTWLATDRVTDRTLASWWRDPGLHGRDAAYLQYTSGSTARPKGVVVSHENVLANSWAIANRTHTSTGDLNVTWLPHFHDMGLVDGLLQSVYSGHCTVILSPQAFLKRPIRWLQAISKYGATRTGAPNFAYDECVRTTTEEQRAGLDLRSLRTAYCGSEPIRSETLVRFYQAFARAGLRPNALRPCYGLAEATLCVSVTGVSEPAGKVPVEGVGWARRVQCEGEPADRIRSYVHCGEPVDNLRVEIVDPQTRRRSADGAVGEIWIAGPGVCSGYWKIPNDGTAFGARLEGDEHTVFLRTGDVGLLAQGRVVVIGRIKDLIIVGGRNVHAEDIELTAAGCDRILSDSACAAFAVDDGVTEKLVLVIALPRRGAPSGVTERILAIAVRRAVAEEHGVGVADLVFVRATTMPRTSSGKIQRGRCREAYLAGELDRCRWGDESADSDEPMLREGTAG